MTKREKLHTFEEWKSGKVMAKESDFQEGVWQKILQEQKRIFEQAVEIKESELQKEFEESYSNSLDPEIMSKNELDWIREILYGDKPIRKEKTLGNGYSMPIINEELSNVRYIFRQMSVGNAIPDFRLIEYPDIRTCLKFHPELSQVILAKALHRYFMWLSDITEQSVKKMVDEILTTKQQILAIFYLSKHEILYLKRIHQDFSAQARLLNPILNRNFDNVERYLREIHTEDYKRKYFTKENLEAVRKVFLKAQQQVIVDEIDLELKTINKKKE